MREILFKAKGRDGEGWHEGYYWSTQDTTYCFSEDYKKNPKNTHHYLLFDKMTDWGLPNQKLKMDINPKTLCQYTGLVDKNGKKIWEHDIVKYPDYELLVSGDTEEIINEGYVEYDIEAMCYYFTDRIVIDMDDIDVSKEVEVIGNKFDNAEPLENGNDG